MHSSQTIFITTQPPQKQPTSHFALHPPSTIVTTTTQTQPKPPHSITTTPNDDVDFDHVVLHQPEPCQHRYTLPEPSTASIAGEQSCSVEVPLVAVHVASSCTCPCCVQHWQGYSFPFWTWPISHSLILLYYFATSFYLLTFFFYFLNMFMSSFGSFVLSL